MRNRFPFFVLFLCILLGSCVKEFTPEVRKYDSLLVVEGAITDQPGPYTVKLSVEGKLSEKPQYTPYSKCVVEISDNVGNSEVLHEVTAGVYKTDSITGLQGIPGRKYKVKISTPDGEICQSQEEVLKSGVPIDSVYAIQEKKDGRDGYQFYVDANPAGTDSSYFFWSLESTYKFNTTYYIFFYYDGVSIQKLKKYDSLRTCYRTQRIMEIYTLNAGEQSRPQVQHFPLNFEDTYSPATFTRYSLNTTQYTLGKRAYTFWNTIKKMSHDQGQIFSQQPYQIKGNIVNTTNPDSPVLGYFMAAGISQKRIFVNHLPFDLYHIPKCDFDSAHVGDEDIHTRVTHAGIPLPFFIAPSKENPLSGEIIWGVIVGKEIDAKCVDCRETGYLKRPSFWVD